jgi:D-alanyl-D-alanine carboxypeptidase
MGRTILATAALVAALACALAAGAGLGGAAGRSAPDDPAFEGSSEPLDAKLRKRMTGKSWHEGCPVGFGKLRLLDVTHWGFDDEAHNGRLVVHRRVAGAVLEVMEALYEDRYPIRRMVLIDRYGADDQRSMNADNTSAFNCRFVAGQPGTWSQHAYGLAIDVNPIENPYVSGDHVSPAAGRPYADRSKNEPGMIHDGDSTVRAFATQGFEWGGNWSPAQDYQHFSANGK